MRFMKPRVLALALGLGILCYDAFRLSTTLGLLAVGATLILEAVTP